MAKKARKRQEIQSGNLTFSLMCLHCPLMVAFDNFKCENEKAGTFKVLCWTLKAAIVLLARKRVLPHCHCIKPGSVK